MRVYIVYINMPARHLSTNIYDNLSKFVLAVNEPGNLDPEQQ